MWGVLRLGSHQAADQIQKSETNLTSLVILFSQFDFLNTWLWHKSLLVFKRCSIFGLFLRTSWQLWTRPGTRSTSFAHTAETTLTQKVKKDGKWICLWWRSLAYKWVYPPSTRFSGKRWETVLLQGLPPPLCSQVLRLRRVSEGELPDCSQRHLAPRVLRLHSEPLTQTTRTQPCIPVWEWLRKIPAHLLCLHCFNRGSDENHMPDEYVAVEVMMTNQGIHSPLSCPPHSIFCTQQMATYCANFSF